MSTRKQIDAVLRWQKRHPEKYKVYQKRTIEKRKMFRGDNNKKHKEWREKNKERLRLYRERYRERYKEKNKIYQKIYYEKHKKESDESHRKSSHERRLQLRILIFERDAFTCQFCGRKSPEVKLEIDHIFPKSKGGRSEKENYRTLCRECNLGKGDMILNEFRT